VIQVVRIRRGVVAGVFLGAFVALAGAQQGGRRNPAWDWPTYNRDLAGTRYSPLNQIFPGITGGVNWGGTATDPWLGFIFVNSKDEPTTGWIAPQPALQRAAEGRGVSLRAAERRPCERRGARCGRTVARQPGLLPSALGQPDGGERRHRRVRVARAAGRERRHARGQEERPSPGYGGPIVTAGGLVFIGATRDRRFRAFDSRNGKELWSTRFDYNVTAIPITYMGRNGKQYVAVTAATQGQGNNESLHVFALP
jgi:hypothetical protein